MYTSITGIEKAEPDRHSGIFPIFFKNLILMPHLSAAIKEYTIILLK